MKRVLCGALLSVAALSVPASASSGPELSVVKVVNDSSRLGVYTGIPGQPLLGVTYYKSTGEVCVGFSLQVPQCVGGPIN